MYWASEFIDSFQLALPVWYFCDLKLKATFEKIETY